MKSNVDQTQIEIRYPSLVPNWQDSGTVALLSALIVDAEEDVPAASSVNLRERAIISLVAHRVILRQQEAGGDMAGKFVLSKVSAGGVSSEFVAPPPEGLPPEDAHYYTTQPGVDYMELIARIVGGGPRLVS